MGTTKTVTNGAIFAFSSFVLYLFVIQFRIFVTLVVKSVPKNFILVYNSSIYIF